MSIVDSLIDFAKKCTVKLQLPRHKGGFCTGFFAAPQLIISCRHGLADNGTPVSVKFEWNSRTYAAQPLIIPDISDEIDYSAFQCELENHPFLPLCPERSINDEVFISAFSIQRPEGTGRMARFDSTSDEENGILFIELKDTQLEGGMSGAPLLDIRTGAVCGIVKTSRDPTRDLGGRAVSAESILRHMREKEDYDYSLSTLPKEEWYEMIDAEQKRLHFGSGDFPDHNVTWQLALRAQLDEAFAAKRDCYLDFSSQRVRRIIRKLDALVDFEALLSVQERHALIATLALHTLGRLSACDSFIQAIQGLKRNELTRAIENTLNIADTGFENHTQLPKVAEFRCDLLAALTLLGECLDLEWDAISTWDATPDPPPEEADHTAWIAYLTRRIYIPHKGILVYQVLVPLAQQDKKDLITRCEAVHFSLLYQRLRETLTAYGISVSRGRSEVAFCRNTQPVPDHVLENLKNDAKKKGKEIRRLEHLGPRDELEHVPIEELLPIPESAVSGKVVFTAPPSTECRIRLRPEKGPVGLEETISIESDCKGRLCLNADKFPKNTRFSWQIECDLGGIPEIVKAGIFRTLSDREKAELERFDDEAPLRLEQIQTRIGLWSPVLIVIWNRIERNKVSMDDLLLAHTRLVSAFEWSYRNDTDSKLFEKYLDACNWLKRAIDTFAK